MSPRSSRIEALEPRRVLAAPTLGDLPSEINIASGAPLHLALGGQDVDGDDLTYTVSSTNTDISASIPKQLAPNGNRSLRITVQNYGTMVFELFEGRAPETTQRIIEIADSDWYDSKIFHRVIDGFMIQGGSRDGQGVNGTGVQFDDEYHADLQFTGSGLLAMAKSGDDTNDSQFFITDASTRWLDFNHTIFGKLTVGDDVLEAISQAPVNGSTPTNDIVITSVEVVEETQNAVMMIAAPHGTTGEGDVTVTVSDGNGGTASKTIKVTAQLDSQNNNPFLGPIDPIWLTIDQPYSFQLEATDIEGDPVFYRADLLTQTDDIEVTVTENGLVTVTPRNGVVGAAEIAFRVGPTAASLVPDGSGNFQEATIDSQTVSVFIPPAKPVIEFAPGMDTGAADGSTQRDNTEGKELHFEVHDLTAVSTLAVFLNGVETTHTEISRIPQGDGSANFVATLRLLDGAKLDDGDYTLHVQQLLPLGQAYGNESLASELSEVFAFDVDTVAPEITSEAVDIAFQGQDYFYDVDALDQGGSLSYEIQAPIPDGMVQDVDTGEIYWTPTNDPGFVQPIVVLVHDGAGNVGRQEFDITIFAQLEIDIEGSLTVDEFQTVSLLITATDPSGELGSDFTISLQDGVLPVGADAAMEELSGNQARFTWTTTEADGPGVHDLVFEAGNGTTAMGQETVQIAVGEVNQSPEFTQVFDSWTGTEDERIDLQFVAADGDLPANELVFDLFGEVPEGADIDPDSGLFTWTPDETTGGGEFTFGVRVTDSGQLSAEHSIVIAVTENQKAPVFEATPDQQVTEGDVLDFVVVADDPDIPARPLQYRLEGDVPQGLTIDAETGRVQWEVPQEHLSGGQLRETFELTVVAQEVVSETEVAIASRQVIEIEVLDNLADLVAATLALTGTAIAVPLPGAADVSLALPEAQFTEFDAVFQFAEVYDDASFFGTQFGPTGAGGGESESDGSEPGEAGEDAVEIEIDPGASNLDRLIDEIGEATIEALVAATAAQSTAAAEHPEPVEAPPVVEPADPETEPAEAELASQEVAAARDAEA